MKTERYEEHLEVSLADYRASGWKEALKHPTKESYSAMWHTLSEAARTAIEQGRNKHGKVLWMLADACSMMLSPARPNEPFKPIAVFPDWRSVIPDDLSEMDMALFAQIVDEVDDPRLRARLADLVWLRGKSRDPEYALKAIDAYRCLSLDQDSWISDGSECWARAISLAKMLKAGAGDRLEQMEVSIVSALLLAGKADGFLGLWLAGLLNSNGLGRRHRADVAKKLEILAHEFEEDGDLHRAREYFSSAAEWYRGISEEVKSAEMTVAVAEGWVKEAVARAASEAPSHMVAASFYENAIQTYRMVARTQRETYRVDERIGELRSRLSDSGERALGEMATISTPGVDITHIIENARKSVTGKSVQEALLAFANLHSGVSVEEMRRDAVERMRQHPLQSLFGTTVMSRDGRVIAKRPAMSFGGGPSASEEISVRAQMINDYAVLVSIVVQGDIWPALEVLSLEHRLREDDFVGIARRSPIVPKERAGIFGKGLFAGYERDFVTALHLLVPQIEHMVRVHLKQAGAKTTNLDK